jgi:polysaccharide biosynthesis transport protein
MGQNYPIQFVLGQRLLPALLTCGSVLGSAFLYLQQAKPTYEVTSRLVVESRSSSVSELGRAITKLPDTVPGGSTPLANQAELVKSRRVLERAIAQSLTPNDAPEITADKLLLKKSIKAKMIPATNILELTYEEGNPQRAAKLLNAVVGSIITEDANLIRKEASSVRAFLEARVPEQENRLNQIESEESLYRQSTGVVAGDAQSNGLVTNLADVENQQRQVVAQLREARTKSDMLQKITQVKAPEAAYAATRVGQDEQLRNARVKLAEAEGKVIEIRSRLGDKHPDLLAAIEQRDELRKLYNNRVTAVISDDQPVPKDGLAATDEVSRNLLSQYIVGETDRAALDQRLQVLTASKDSLLGRLEQLPSKQQGLIRILRQREDAGNTLKLLRTKLEEARIAEAQIISNLRVLDPATVPTKPTQPKPMMVMALATLAGLILATALVLILNLLDNTLRRPEELAKLVQLPVLGKVPKLPRHPSFANLESFLNTPQLIEPYRLLLKSLERHTEEIPRADADAIKGKMLVISSVLQGEGKSNLVAYLGAVAATLSWKILIIDADYQNPVQSTLLGVQPRLGLTDVVLQQKPLTEAIQATHLDNLFLLPYGSASQRPSAIIESPVLRELLKQAQSMFDLVIIDSSPLNLCVDAISLSQNQAHLALVARPGFSQRTLLQQTVADLQASKVKPLGIIINGNRDSNPSHQQPTPQASNPIANQFSAIPSVPK